MSLPSASSTWTGMCSPSILKVPSTGSPCWRKLGLSPQSVALVSGEARSWGRVGVGRPQSVAGRPSVLGGQHCASSSLQVTDISLPPGPSQTSARPTLLGATWAQSLLESGAFSCEMGLAPPSAQ